MDDITKMLKLSYEKSLKKYPFFETYEPHKRETWTKRFGEVNEDIFYDGKVIHKNTTVKITMMSRFGDVGINTNLNLDNGYQTRIPLHKIDNLRGEEKC